MSEDNAPHPTTAVRVEVEYPVAAERVYAMFTEADRFASWSWGSLGKEVRAEVDARVGGSYSVTTQGVGEDGSPAKWTFSGKFLELNRPTKLVYSLHWDAPMGYVAPDETVTVELSGTANSTRLLMIHDGIPDIGPSAATHEAGIRDMLRLLGEKLAD